MFASTGVMTHLMPMRTSPSLVIFAAILRSWRDVCGIGCRQRVAVAAGTEWLQPRELNGRGAAIQPAHSIAKEQLQYGICALIDYGVSLGLQAIGAWADRGVKLNSFL